MQWSNYPKAIGDLSDIGSTTPLWVGFKNSAIVVGTSVFLIALIAPLAGYSLSTMNFRGKKVIFYIFISGMFLGGPALPAMLRLMQNLGLLTVHPIWLRYFCLILPYVAGAMPFSILLMWSYFGSTPRVMGDAAKVDGLSPFATYWKVMLPLALPALWTIIILQAVWIWNEYMLSLILIGSIKGSAVLSPLPLTLAGFAGATASDLYFGIFAAGVMISALPTIILYIIFSEQIRKGMSMQIVKG
jgi:raffinose/stachyose/melibiose transport system permease protein